MNKSLRNALIAVAASAAFVLALPFLVPVDAYRTPIESAAAHATGRALRIEGPLRLMIFPRFGLRAERVTFANMRGGRAAAMASVGDIEIGFHVLPLFSGILEVDQIVLDRPVIELEINAAGQANWNLAKSKGAGSGGSSVTLPMDTEFSGIGISDGRISYGNAKTGTHRAVDHVNATIALTRLDRPVPFKGNFTVGGRRVDFGGEIATLKSLLSDETTALDLSLTSDMMKASFKGLMTQSSGTIGQLSFDTANLRGVADWLGGKLPAGGGLGAMSLESHVVNKDKVTTLSGMRLALDRQNLTGTVTLDTRENVPSVQGALAIDHLDLNPYLQADSKPPERKAVPNGNTGWSREPISIALLKELDAQVSLTTGTLRLRGLRLGNAVATVSLAGGVLIARLDPIMLYGGTGHAEFNADARGAIPAIRNTLRFDHVALRPFLDDTLGVDRFEGTGSLSLDVSAQGASPDAIMHALTGKGVLTAGRGRIRGVDLGRVARTIQWVLGAGATGDATGTDYLDLSETFVIAQGVLTNTDFYLSGPVLSATGAGAVDIGNRNIDFRLVPKARANGLSVGIPVRVKGSWDHVHYAPDLTGIAKGVLQNLESGRAPFKGLLGGGDKTQDQNGSKKKKKNVGDVLKNIFGIH